jgi:glycerophosphoryl diester phosphodiesterase
MIEVHGHRGARGLAPENTLGGFTRAIALGVDAIECDVTLTADGVVVVSHDPALNPDLTRGPNGCWLDAPGRPIRDMRYDELIRYDVGRARPGGAVAQAFPDQVAEDGARIPRLAEVLALHPGIRVDIELKLHPELTVPPDQLAAAVAEVVHGQAQRVTMMSFDWLCLRWFRRYQPQLRLGWLTAAATTSPSMPAAVAAEGGPAWMPDFATLTQADLDEAHHLGLSVIPWTVNQPADMVRLQKCGVDGLITDRPDVCLLLLGR